MIKGIFPKYIFSKFTLLFNRYSVNLNCGSLNSRFPTSHAVASGSDSVAEISLSPDQQRGLGGRTEAAPLTPLEAAVSLVLEDHPLDTDSGPGAQGHTAGLVPDREME